MHKIKTLGDNNSVNYFSRLLCVMCEVKVTTRGKTTCAGIAFEAHQGGWKRRPGWRRRWHGAQDEDQDQVHASTSSIGQHLLDNVECLESYHLSKFQIVRRARCESILHILEPLYIKLMEPDLCKQLQFVRTLSLFASQKKKKKKSKHCSYHAISAWSGDWHSGTTGRDFGHRCTPKRNQAWFFDIPW